MSMGWTSCRVPGPGLADSLTDIHAGTNLLALAGKLTITITNSTAAATNGSAVLYHR